MKIMFDYRDQLAKDIREATTQGNNCMMDIWVSGQSEPFTQKARMRLNSWTLDDVTLETEWIDIGAELAALEKLLAPKSPEVKL